MDQTRETECWDEWVRRQREDPETPTAQMVKAGVSFDTALILTMLGKIHNELVEAVDGPRDDWKGS